MFDIFTRKSMLMLCTQYKKESPLLYDTPYNKSFVRKKCATKYQSTPTCTNVYVTQAPIYL